jgi:hypothetical protein
MLRMLPIFLCVCVIGCTANAQSTIPTPMQSSNMDVGQYATEVQAKPVCGSDKTVWEDPNTGQLYPLTDKHDRNTNDGTYVCKSFALENGMVMVQ